LVKVIETSCRKSLKINLKKEAYQYLNQRASLGAGKNKFFGKFLNVKNQFSVKATMGYQHLLEHSLFRF